MGAWGPLFETAAGGGIPPWGVSGCDRAPPEIRGCPRVTVGGMAGRGCPSLPPPPPNLGTGEGVTVSRGLLKLGGTGGPPKVRGHWGGLKEGWYRECLNGGLLGVP